MNEGRNIYLGFRWDDNDFFKVSPHKKSNYPYTVIDMQALQLYAGVKFIILSQMSKDFVLFKQDKGLA